MTATTSLGAAAAAEGVSAVSATAGKGVDDDASTANTGAAVAVGVAALRVAPVVAAAEGEEEGSTCFCQRLASASAASDTCAMAALDTLCNKFPIFVFFSRLISIEIRSSCVIMSIAPSESCKHENKRRDQPH